MRKFLRRLHEVCIPFWPFVSILLALLVVFLALLVVFLVFMRIPGVAKG